MNGLIDFLDAQRANSILAARVALAAILIVAGFSKLFNQGIPAVTDGFDGMGLPLAVVLAPVVSFLEFFGGIAILLGVGCRLLSIWVIVQFTLISIYVKPMLQGEGWGSIRLTVCIAVLGLIVAAHGPGPLALGRRMMGRRWAQ